MLPKFLIADNSQETPDLLYVVHTQEPRFIVKSDVEDFWNDQEVFWLSDEPSSKDIINQLLEEAEEFLEKELESQDYKVDQIELWVEGRAESGGVSRLFVSTEGQKGYKVILKPR